jgi:hypothetical protein
LRGGACSTSTLLLIYETTIACRAETLSKSEKLVHHGD